jgi:hypothetical protein
MRIRSPVSDTRHQDILDLLPVPGREVLARHAGQRASFTGRLVWNPPGFARRVGMVPSEGAALALRQGRHIEVAYADITLEPKGA